MTEWCVCGSIQMNMRQASARRGGGDQAPLNKIEDAWAVRPMISYCLVSTRHNNDPHMRRECLGRKADVNRTVMMRAGARVGIPSHGQWALWISTPRGEPMSTPSAKNETRTNCEVRGRKGLRPRLLASIAGSPVVRPRPHGPNTTAPMLTIVLSYCLFGVN